MVRDVRQPSLASPTRPSQSSIPVATQPASKLPQPRSRALRSSTSTLARDNAPAGRTRVPVRSRIATATNAQPRASTTGSSASTSSRAPAPPPPPPVEAPRPEPAMVRRSGPAVRRFSTLAPSPAQGPLTSTRPSARRSGATGRASPDFLRGEETMIYNVAPPSDLPSSSLFGDEEDPDPGPSVRPRLGAAGVGHRSTPIASQDLAGRTLQARNSVAKVSTESSLPRPDQATARSRVRPRELSPIQMRSLSSPDDTVIEYDVPIRDDGSPTPKRRRTTPPDENEAPPTIASRRRSTSATPKPRTTHSGGRRKSTNSQGSLRDSATPAPASRRPTPATAPVKRPGRDLVTATPKEQILKRLLSKSPPASVQVETANFRRTLPPSARKALKGRIVGHMPTPIVATEGEDPLLLKRRPAKRRRTLDATTAPATTRRSNNLPRAEADPARPARSKVPQTAPAKSLRRYSGDDLAEYGNVLDEEDDSDADDGPANDTFADVISRRNGRVRPVPSTLSRISEQGVREEDADAADAEHDDLATPRAESPFVPPRNLPDEEPARAQPSTLRSPSVGPGRPEDELSLVEEQSSKEPSPIPDQSREEQPHAEDQQKSPVQNIDIDFRPEEVEEQEEESFDINDHTVMVSPGFPALREFSPESSPGFDLPPIRASDAPGPMDSPLFGARRSLDREQSPIFTPSLSQRPLDEVATSPIFRPRTSQVVYAVEPEPQAEKVDEVSAHINDTPDDWEEDDRFDHADLYHLPSSPSTHLAESDDERDQEVVNTADKPKDTTIQLTESPSKEKHEGAGEAQDLEEHVEPPAQTETAPAAWGAVKSPKHIASPVQPSKIVVPPSSPPFPSEDFDDEDTATWAAAHGGASFREDEDEGEDKDDEPEDGEQENGPIHVSPNKRTEQTHMDISEPMAGQDNNGDLEHVQSDEEFDAEGDTVVIEELDVVVVSTEVHLTTSQRAGQLDHEVPIAEGDTTAIVAEGVEDDPGRTQEITERQTGQGLRDVEIQYSDNGGEEEFDAEGDTVIVARGGERVTGLPEDEAFHEELTQRQQGVDDEFDAEGDTIIAANDDSDNDDVLEQSSPMLPGRSTAEESVPLIQFSSITSVRSYRSRPAMTPTKVDNTVPLIQLSSGHSDRVDRSPTVPHAARSLLPALTAAASSPAAPPSSSPAASRSLVRDVPSSKPPSSLTGSPARFPRLDFRQSLAKPQTAHVNPSPPKAQVQQSPARNVRSEGGHTVEMVYIPEPDRAKMTPTPTKRRDRSHKSSSVSSPSVPARPALGVSPRTDEDDAVSEDEEEAEVMEPLPVRRRMFAGSTPPPRRYSGTSQGEGTSSMEIHVDAVDNDDDGASSLSSHGDDKESSSPPAHAQSRPLSTIDEDETSSGRVVDVAAVSLPSDSDDALAVDEGQEMISTLDTFDRIEEEQISLPVRQPHAENVPSPIKELYPTVPKIVDQRSTSSYPSLSTTEPQGHSPQKSMLADPVYASSPSRGAHHVSPTAAHKQVSVSPRQWSPAFNTRSKSRRASAISPVSSNRLVPQVGISAPSPAGSLLPKVRVVLTSRQGPTGPVVNDKKLEKEITPIREVLRMPPNAPGPTPAVHSPTRSAHGDGSSSDRLASFLAPHAAPPPFVSEPASPSPHTSDVKNVHGGRHSLSEKDNTGSECGADGEILDISASEEQPMRPSQEDNIAAESEEDDVDLPVYVGAKPSNVVPAASTDNAVGMDDKAPAVSSLESDSQFEEPIVRQGASTHLSPVNEGSELNLFRSPVVRSSPQGESSIISQTSVSSPVSDATSRATAETGMTGVFGSLVVGSLPVVAGTAVVGLTKAVAESRASASPAKSATLSRKQPLLAFSPAEKLGSSQANPERRGSSPVLVLRESSVTSPAPTARPIVSPTKRRAGANKAGAISVSQAQETSFPRPPRPVDSRSSSLALSPNRPVTPTQENTAEGVHATPAILLTPPSVSKATQTQQSIIFPARVSPRQTPRSRFTADQSLPSPTWRLSNRSPVHSDAASSRGRTSNPPTPSRSSRLETNETASGSPQVTAATPRRSPLKPTIPPSPASSGSIPQEVIDLTNVPSSPVPVPASSPVPELTKSVASEQDDTERDGTEDIDADVTAEGDSSAWDISTADITYHSPGMPDFGKGNVVEESSGGVLDTSKILPFRTRKREWSPLGVPKRGGYVPQSSPVAPQPSSPARSVLQPSSPASRVLQPSSPAPTVPQTSSPAIRVLNLSRPSPRVIESSSPVVTEAERSIRAPGPAPSSNAPQSSPSRLLWGHNSEGSCPAEEVVPALEDVELPELQLHQDSGLAMAGYDSGVELSDEEMEEEEGQGVDEGMEENEAQGVNDAMEEDEERGLNDDDEDQDGGHSLDPRYSDAVEEEDLGDEADDSGPTKEEASYEEYEEPLNDDKGRIVLCLRPIGVVKIEPEDIPEPQFELPPQRVSEAKPNPPFPPVAPEAVAPQPSPAVPPGPSRLPLLRSVGPLATPTQGSLGRAGQQAASTQPSLPVPGVAPQRPIAPLPHRMEPALTAPAPTKPAPVPEIKTFSSGNSTTPATRPSTSVLSSAAPPTSTRSAQASTTTSASGSSYLPPGLRPVRPQASVPERSYEPLLAQIRQQNSSQPRVPSSLSRSVPIPDTPSSQSEGTEVIDVEDDDDSVSDADTSYRSIVEVASLDPRAAARAAAILKMHHAYIEHGVNPDETPGPESSPQGATSTPQASSTHTHVTPRYPHRSPHRTPRTERSRHFATIESARKLTNHELLHEAELEIVNSERRHGRRSRSRSASHVTPPPGEPGTTDSPVVPGAWTRTPKRKRKSDESSEHRHQHHLGELAEMSVAKKRLDASGTSTPWLVSDWKRLEKVYRRARKEWLAQGGTWDPHRVVDSFMEKEGVSERDLVGEWERGVIVLRVEALDRRLSAKYTSEGEPATKRSRLDPDQSALAPPSTIKRMLNWVWGSSSKPQPIPTVPASQPQTQTPRPKPIAHRHTSLYDEMQAVEASPGSNGDRDFLKVRDETFDFSNVSIAQTPSRASGLHNAPVRKSYGVIEQSQIDEEDRNNGEHDDAEDDDGNVNEHGTSWEMGNGVNKSPDPFTEDGGTPVVSPEKILSRPVSSRNILPPRDLRRPASGEYRYGPTAGEASTSRLFPPLYPSLPDRTAALAPLVSGTPRPQKRVRLPSGETSSFDLSADLTGSTSSSSGWDAIPDARSMRPGQRPNVRNIAASFEASGRLDLSFESQRREREKRTVGDLGRVKKGVETVRQRGHDSFEM